MGTKFIWVWLLQRGERREISRPIVLKRTLECSTERTGVTQRQRYSSKTRAETENRDLPLEMSCIFLDRLRLLNQHCGPPRQIPNNFLQKILFPCSRNGCAFTVRDLLFFREFLQVQSEVPGTGSTRSPVPRRSAQPSAHWRHYSINSSVCSQKRTGKTNSKPREISAYGCPQMSARRVKTMFIMGCSLGENTTTSEAHTELFKETLLRSREFPGSGSSSVFIFVLLLLRW